MAKKIVVHGNTFRNTCDVFRRRLIFEHRAKSVQYIRAR